MQTTNAVVSAKRSLPGPRGLPWVGMLPHVSRHGLLATFETLWPRYGDMFEIHVAKQRMIVMVHPDAVQHVLVTSADRYVKADTYDPFRQLVGNGMLTLEGDAWRKRRRLAQPVFHRKKLAELVNAMVRATRDAIADWRRRCPDGGRLEVHTEMMRLTLRVVGDTLFGQDVSDDADSSGRAFGEALAYLIERSNAMLQIPLSVPTPANLRFRRTLAVLDRAVAKIVRRARRSPQGPPTLLSMLLDARDAESGEPLSDRDLRDEVITLYLAGHETTALLLTWTFVLLSREPSVVERVRSECQRVLGDRDPTMEDLAQLTYTRQVIDEVLRLRPPAWCLGRDLLHDDEIGGVRIPGKSRILPVPYLTHRHPHFWDEPERFCPERFDPEHVRARHKFAYYPFSVGPRVCIGNHFSLMEAQIVLALIAREGWLRVPMGTHVELMPMMTLRPGGPIPVDLAWSR